MKTIILFLIAMTSTLTFAENRPIALSGITTNANDTLTNFMVTASVVTTDKQIFLQGVMLQYQSSVRGNVLAPILAFLDLNSVDADALNAICQSYGATVADGSKAIDYQSNDFQFVIRAINQKSTFWLEVPYKNYAQVTDIVCKI